MERVYRMEKIYISIYYLKILHYFFFSLAVFTLTAGIIFWESFTLESISLFSMCSVYSVFSLYIARSLYKSYRELAEPVIVVRTYVLPYPLLVFWIFALTFLLVYVFPYLTELVFAFLFVNYYILFLLIIGFLIGRLRIVGRLFDVYSYFTLKKAQSVASKYSHVVDVMEYEVGSDPEVDEILDDIWSHRDYPLTHVKELETRLCEIQVIKISKTIKILERRKDRIKEEDRLLEGLKDEKSEYMKKIEEIQKFGD